MKKIIIAVFYLFLLMLYLTIKAPQAIGQETAELEKNEKELNNVWSGESVRRSILLYQNEVVKNKIKGNFYEVVSNLQKIAEKEILLGDYQKSLSTLTEVIKLQKENNLTKVEIKTLCFYALALFKSGNVNNSLFFLDKAIAKLNSNSDSQEKALAYSTKAEILYYQRDLNASKKFYEEAISNWSNTNDEENEAYTLISYSYVFMASDNSDFGLQIVREAESKFITLNNNRGIALARIAMGHLYNSIGEKQTALNYYLKAESMFPNDMDFIEKARLLNGMGFIYESLNELEISFTKRQEALITFGFDNYQQGQLSTLPPLINLSYLTGRFSLANEYYIKCEKLSQKLNDSFYLAIAKKYVADHYFTTNQNSKAYQYYIDSLPIILKLQTYPVAAVIQQNLGLLDLKEKNLKGARKYYNSSIEISKKIKDKFLVTNTLYNLAKLDQIENNPDEALKNIIESISLTETLYSDVSNTNLQRSYFSNVYDRYELYIYLLMQKHKESKTQDFAIQALQASEKSRSRSLLETLRLSEANFTKDANPELVSKEKEILSLLTLKTSKLTDLLSRNAEKTETDKIDDEIRTLNHDLENIRADLKQNSPVYSAIKNPPPFDVAEFQKNILDDKSVLLEFSLGERESYLWLVSKNEVSHFVLPARNIIENRVDKIRQNFESRQILPNEQLEVYQQRMSDLETEFNLEAKLLSNDLLGQTVDKIADKRLVVVPDGKLALLPLSALPAPNSDEPLISHHEIVYEPSASLLNILAKLQNPKHIPTKDLLIFADPVFADNDNRLITKADKQASFPTFPGLNLRDFRLVDENGRIPRLFATQDEADSIVKVVGASNAVIATGFSANRERVLNSNISDYRVLHFATHGLVDVKRPEISSIVLSQFDENGNKQEGFLRLQDIYALDLATDLVVLSACQSGVGKEIKGEGLMSLNNAFLQAGAKSVLSSAWKVDDTATAELMKNFYVNLSEKGVPPSDALRQAQISMLKSNQFKSPFYWAAFTVQGEFRQPISFGKSYFYYYFVLISILLGGLIFLGYRKLKRT